MLSFLLDELRAFSPRGICDYTRGLPEVDLGSRVWVELELLRFDPGSSGSVCKGSWDHWDVVILLYWARSVHS